MSDFSGMEDLLQDFLQEAEDLLSDVDNKLVDLEKTPDDRGLLNDVFRGFHTIKGGAGFLSATELVALCHLTENLFDRLRNGQLVLTTDVMDVIMSATRSVREMFSDLARSVQPTKAPVEVVDGLKRILSSEPQQASVQSTVESLPAPQTAVLGPTEDPSAEGGVNWGALLCSISPSSATTSPPPAAPNSPEKPHPKTTDNVATTHPTPSSTSPRRAASEARETSIRVDTVRLDQVLNLSGEIGLTKNRLTSLRSDLLAGKGGQDTLHALDQAISQLDLLVSDLQNSVMKTRMQPIGRLFQKYPRIARDLARQLGKDVELVLSGEETEVDKNMIEDLADPLIHLVRNAVDHGVENTEERIRLGKPAKSLVRLEARQEGDHIVLVIADDGRGMLPELIRAKAVDKGLIGEEEANGLDERQSLGLIFLPGFSTKTQISDVSGRGVGMDVVKTNIQKLNGTIDIRSEPGKGSVFLISLPLTLAILPVLLVLLGEQPFALPLSLVREILPLEPERTQEVGGKAVVVVRGEALPIYSLSGLLGWPQSDLPQEFGVLMQIAERSFVLRVDSFAGRDDAVIKPLEGFKPRGVAGVTTLSNGQIVLILDMKELLQDFAAQETEGAQRVFDIA